MRRSPNTVARHRLRRKEEEAFICYEKRTQGEEAEEERLYLRSLESRTLVTTASRKAPAGKGTWTSTTLLTWRNSRRKKRGVRVQGNST